MELKQNVRYAKLIDGLDFKMRHLHLPFSGTFELTPRCNMNCKMCYIRMTEQEMAKVGRELDADEWIRIAGEAVKAGMTMALFTGGEAILYKDFKKVYLAVRTMGVFISINTNGTHLTDEWVEFFKQYPPAKFNITIYGGCNETYARLCRNPRGFDQLKETVEKLQANGFEVLLNCMITKQNVDDMEAIYAFGREHGLPIHANTYSFPPVRKEGVDDIDQDRFTPTEAAKARVRVNWNAIHDRERFLARADRILSDIEHAESMEEDCAQVEGDKIKCAAGRSSFWLTWDGRMLPCGMISDFSVSAKGRPFADAWREVVDHADRIVLAPACTNCPKKSLCLPCAAKLKAESGSYDRKAEYKCAYTGEYIRLLDEARTYLRQND